MKLTNDREGNQRLRRPEHSGNIGFRYAGEKLKTSLNTFFGTVNNLLDKDYEESTGYNTADRSFNIGTQVSF